MNSLDALRKFQDMLQQDDHTKKFFQRKLDWIEDRRGMWESDRIRVGVVGVTSSGKSTLINAILGEDILSSAVVPSSGQPVCCSYGVVPEIVVYFENSTTKRLRGKEFSQKNLMQYSDERYNPRNIKKVLRIELTSPKFDLGKDVLLIDSPGLDAYGLESHEKLTLESLVPTIDVCIFVTTLKTNSDGKIRRVLNVVAKYHCPIIVVQNMLDAVRGTPDGKKSADQVALEHRQRVQDVIDQSDVEDKDSVRIVQISAKHAMEWRSREKKMTLLNTFSKVLPKALTKSDYESSNYEEFVKIVTDMLKKKRPYIERQHLQVTFDQMQNVAVEVEKKLSGSTTENFEADFPLRDLKEQCDELLVEFNERLEKMGDYQEVFWEILVAIGEKKGGYPKKNKTRRISKKASDLIIQLKGSFGLESIVKIANDAVKQFEGELTNLVTGCNNFMEKAAPKLRISERDLRCPAAFQSKNITVMTKNVQVQKGGLWGDFLSWVDDWLDTTFAYKTVTVTDEERTKKEICDLLDVASQAMENWIKNNFNPSMGRVLGEIAAEEEDYNEHREDVIEVKSFSRLREELARLLPEIEKELPPQPHPVQIVEQVSKATTRKVEAGPYAGPILQMSREALHGQHQEITRAFIRAVGCTDHTAAFIGWDKGTMDELLYRTGITDAEIILSPVGPVSLPGQEKRCVFVLVDTIRIGAALNQIVPLELEKHLNRSDYVVWVVQDFQVLLTGGGAVEGLSQMVELSSRIRVPCESMVYLLHENPLYNLAFLEYQMDPSLHHAPHRLIQKFQTKYPAYTSENVEKTLSQMLQEVHLEKITRE